MKSTLLFFALSFILLSGCAYNDTSQLSQESSVLTKEKELSIKINELPEKILFYLEDKYPGKTISNIEVEDQRYYVDVSNHTTISFDIDGYFIDSNSKMVAIDAQTMNLERIPEQIIEKIYTDFPGKSILEIREQDDHYNILLSHDVEFNLSK
jgi:hypothetical protein